jgi:hypothetical protein
VASSEDYEACAADKQINFKEFADNINHLVNEKMRELNLDVKEDSEFSTNKMLNVYSAIVQTNEYDIETARIICLTTGTKCVCGEFMCLDGTSLNDWFVLELNYKVLFYPEFVKKKLIDLI